MGYVQLRHVADTDYATNIDDGKKLSLYRYHGKSISNLYGFAKVKVGNFHDNRDVAQALDYSYAVDARYHRGLAADIAVTRHDILTTMSNDEPGCDDVVAGYVEDIRELLRKVDKEETAQFNAFLGK